MYAAFAELTPSTGSRNPHLTPKYFDRGCVGPHFCLLFGLILGFGFHEIDRQ